MSNNTHPTPELYIGGVRNEADRGCITSTPKSTDFLKKWRKTRKYERDSCIPEPKNGERPYLAVPEPTFWGAIFGLFSSILRHFIPPLPTQHTLIIINKLRYKPFTTYTAIIHYTIPFYYNITKESK